MIQWTNLKSWSALGRLVGKVIGALSLKLQVWVLVEFEILPLYCLSFIATLSFKYIPCTEHSNPGTLHLFKQNDLGI